MGFGDLYTFNLAILAKQGWNILQRLDFLLFQILKSWYFPMNSFLDAQLGAIPSYTWKTILVGIEVLLEGLRWTVGDGIDINIDIRELKWIPSTPGYRIQDPQLASN